MILEQVVKEFKIKEEEKKKNRRRYEVTPRKLPRTNLITRKKKWREFYLDQMQCG